MKTIAVIIVIAVLCVATFATIPLFNANAVETLFWQGTAYSATGAPVTTPTLQSGTLYRIAVSSGFYYNTSAIRFAADAQFYTTNTTDGWNWANHFPAPNGHSFLQINGADVNWGPFSNGDTGHTYTITYIGQGSPLTFQIVDWMDQNYTNNECHINIQIQTMTGTDYITIEGVAANDYYSSTQYSYQINQWAAESITSYPALNPANNWFDASKSLRIGMTEYGEFATPANTGIAYGANAAQWANTESWASNAINQALYVQGWVFYMNYTRAGVPRAIEAWAVYSDLATAEAGRKVVSWDGTKAAGATGWSPVLGSLATSGIEILYDSARLGVARCTVVIHDGFYGEDVAQVTFTVVFNKDTKYMTVYKDVKILMDPKVLDLINDFAFSQRYEIDLARGLNPSNQAFIHWYHNYTETVYQHPLTGSNMTDVVQAYDSGHHNIFFAAYWPNCTEYAVYSPLVPDLPAGSHTRILSPGTAIADIPSPQNEPNTPWVIAQWRYQSWNPSGLNYYPNMLHFLAKDPNREIRFVEVAGMTDYNLGSSAYAPFRAMDANDSTVAITAVVIGPPPVHGNTGGNNVDVEVRYLLNSVFNPEDLTTAADTSFMWLGLGQSAATTDSAGGSVMADFEQWAQNEPLGLFDRNDTAFPWTAPTIGMKGTIPYALSNTGNFAPNYLETFSNTGEGTGNDPTTYVRTALNGFAFNYYDAATTARSPPQPIAGGFSQPYNYWYPSKDPLTERWSTSTGTSFSTSPYDAITTDVNGIISLGGMKANGITRYFNDFYYAISREGTSNYALVNGGTVTGTAPTSNGAITTLDYFPLSTWASTKTSFGYTAGYAVIALARDINGTRGLSIYGWDGRDTYWAAAWASQYLSSSFNGWIPKGTVAIVLHISYSSANREPTAFTVVKALGTITEFGANAFATAYPSAITWGGTVTPPTLPSSTYQEWWYAKLPTTSTAKVDFDP
jgi:hypothetical protein